MFVFDLPKADYYFLNSAIISGFIILTYLWDSMRNPDGKMKDKTRIVILVITVLCLVAQGVVSFMLPPLRKFDNLIGIFSFFNTLLFIFFIYKYEFNLKKTS
ncbi:MAG: hypothetical protein A2X64_03470 [Ignavibacteria bacterium GWF2_33_9]|nr:MAG: hypothetical protein A2X64_03470 [Ignavibacteria bacterium GWF2_33_9]